ncbi:MAG: hypothetical protein IOC64_10170 [Methylobacterium sp.]|nr:hypothetical protein [Methylobacterium sp.]MCA3599502.1 hypothetical protein [Methylobacterium sp.]MCA3607039.1 hypothetical protein [Methylobacterium sp.]MCA3610021.1 hypothetical protein [Methylobacterium sp.]MCA3617659.1 hypothetical protein [Methylobacterium sp.]
MKRASDFLRSDRETRKELFASGRKAGEARLRKNGEKTGHEAMLDLAALVSQPPVAA